jgi:hypothetical protein
MNAKKGFTRPSQERTATARAAEKLTEGGPYKLVLKIPPEAAHALKVRAAEKRTTQAKYVLALLRRDGVTWQGDEGDEGDQGR